MISIGKAVLRITECGAIFAAVLAAALTAGFAQDAAEPAQLVLEPPPYREIWVPTEHLDAVLKKMPRAVMLTPEQYRTLLRDAERIEKTEDPALKAPVGSLVRDVVFEGELTNEIARITARYTVESFTDEWSEIPLVLPWNKLARVEVDDQSALRVAPPPKGKNPQPVLVVRGKGEHLISAEFHLPVSRSPAGNAIQFKGPGVVAASMRLTVPDGAKLDSSLPFITGEQDPNVAQFVLPAERGKPFEIRWTARNIDAIPDAAVFQTCSYLYSIDSSRVQADLGLVLSSSLADLPNEFRIVLPEGVRVLSVEGSELLSWDAVAAESGTGIEVVLVGGKRQAADLRILAEADIDAAADADVTVALPIAVVSDVHRASGTMALIGSDDVRVKNIITGPLTVAAPEALEPAILEHPDFVAGFRFPVTTTPPEVTLSPVQERFNAQLDTRIELKRESIHLTRNLTMIPLEGRLFETEIELPDGEEFLNLVSAAEGAGFSWTRIEGNRVRLAWQQGLVEGERSPVLTIESRRDPEGWFELSDEAMALNFANAVIADAETVSGYVAIAFDESFRVETTTADGLEPRDSRTTPVNGALAWFRLSDYTLELNAARRATEIEAAVIAYALPLQSSLEIEGQLDLEIRYTPVSEVIVKLDPAIAEFVRWDSPLLAEKRLNNETGEWTLDFHDELGGLQRLRFRMALPFEMEESSEDTEQKRFAVAAPVFSVPAAKRVRGDWIIEANTDTELDFEASGVDAVDSLRAPAVAGYQPRHRVIAAYQYRGDAYELKIAGTRHAPEDLVATVVDTLRIDTVVSTDGSDRHQAQLGLRTSGEQFLEIGLPEGAVVWTLTVDGEAVKPVSVENAPDTLRVQLPAHEDASRQSISLKLIYQTPGKKWGGSGGEALEPIRLAERIPVMRSEWLLHLPEGFDYQRFKSNLQEGFEVIDRTLLGQAWNEGIFLHPLMVTGLVVVAESRSAPPQIVASTRMAAPQQIAAEAGFEAYGWEIPMELGSPSTAVAERNPDVERMLKTIIIPSIDFENTPLPDALAYLRGRAQEIHPEGRGLSFIIDLGTNLGGTPPDPFGGGPVFDTSPAGATPGFGGGGVKDTQISLKLSNVPLGEALGYTLALADLKYIVEPQAIVIVPRHTPDVDLYAVTYALPPALLPTILREGVPGGPNAPPDPFSSNVPAGTDQPEKMTAKELFESYGVNFGPGAGVDIDESTGRMIVTNTEDQHDLVVAVMESLRENFDPASVNLWAFRQSKERLKKSGQAFDMEGDAIFVAREADSDTDRVAAVEKKLKSVIMPSIEFVNTPLRDALDFLRSRAQELDTDPNPASRGVDFILDTFRGGVPAGVGGVEDTQITLQLSNVPLGEALRYTLKLANLKYKVEPQAVVIVPISAPDTELYTNTIVVPPSFLSSAPGAGGGGGAAPDPFAAPAAAGGGGGVSQRMTAKEVLEAYGVEFGPGATATYNPQTSTIVVRNTQDQMDLVEAVNMSLVKGPSTVEDEDELLAQGILIDSADGEDVEIGRGVDLKTQLPGEASIVIATESGGISFERAPDDFGARADSWNKTLNDLVIPEFKIENQSLSQAVQLLEREAKKAAGGHAAGTPSIQLNQPVGGSVSLNLKNVPLTEALRRMTEASGTEYRVTASGVVIAAPGILPPESLQTLVLELPNSAFEVSDGNGGIHKISARMLLTGAGIAFPPGTSTAYNRTTQRLAVKNTPGNLEMVRRLFSQATGTADSGAFAATTIGGGTAGKLLTSAEALGLKGFDFRHAGLIPLDFELPQSGRSYSFSGLYAPEPITFRYVNWERQIRFAWFWILVGALGFWFVAVRKLKHPIVIGILGIIALTFVPLIISQSLLAFCNSLLIGWLLGAALWLAWTVRMWLSRVFANADKKEPEADKEAAVSV